VNGLRIAEGAALGNLDRVDVADQVADAGVRRGQLLAVPLGPVQPGDRQQVAGLLDQPAGGRGERQVRVFAQLRAGDVRRPLVEQVDQAADQPGLALAAFAEQDHVVAGQQRPLHLGQHGVVVTDDAREAGRAGSQPVEQVVAQLLLDGAELVAGGPQLADGARKIGGWGGRDRSWRVCHAIEATPGL
jgi:hypothetical protein